MSGETLITVVGNLTDDPELRYLPSGAAMARFRIASTPRTFDKATGEWKDGDPMFLRCAAWRDLAEHVAESLARGHRVVVHGRLRQSHWETPDGEKRSMLQLDVEDIGPSLRYATAAVKKASRANGANGTGGAGTPVGTPPDDPFATATPARTGTADGFTEEPPF